MRVFYFTMILFLGFSTMARAQFFIADGGSFRWSNPAGENALLKAYNAAHPELVHPLPPLHWGGSFDLGLGYRFAPAALELLYHYQAMKTAGKGPEKPGNAGNKIALSRPDHSLGLSLELDMERWGIDGGVLYHLRTYHWIDEPTSIDKRLRLARVSALSFTASLHYTIYRSEYTALSIRPFLELPLTAYDITALRRQLDIQGPERSQERAYGVRFIFANGPQGQ